MIKSYQEQVMKTYEEMRDMEVKSLSKRKNEISKRVPRITEIDSQIAKLSLELSLNILKNKQNNLDNYISNIKNRITDLRVKKSELLVANGYTADYLDMHYNCPKCQDTGFNKTSRCSCYKSVLTKVLYKNSELRHILEQNNFDHFNFDYFSNYRSPKEPQSPKENIQSIMSIAWNFIENFDSSTENLLFFGNSGTGKSFLAHCIAKELIDNGYMVVYKTAVELINELREIRFNPNQNLENILINCDLLIIDDLGTEPLTEFSKVEFFNLLNRKLLKRKKMIVSTNFSIEGLLKTYSERISSRLLGNFTLCKFFGEDIRVKINLERKGTI
ncbi:ATP-binding protein [Clostridium tetani]|uniref:DNA replication protein DnaC n=1 Tax=Clostridium tetani TaxID=1513 RepID=A0ABY0EUW8_CLOTA|nr:ATP-binding protein [Clostridium tetani]KHO40432.1 DNA replication protein DnaC [Clostridium tetani]RXI58307.1 DNA replication protein DnaC [Clostridium tetani]RXI70619.1 DNA replication protein DnaC [Clostridium tetani]